MKKMINQFKEDLTKVQRKCYIFQKLFYLHIMIKVQYIYLIVKKLFQTYVFTLVHKYYLMKIYFMHLPQYYQKVYQKDFPQGGQSTFDLFGCVGGNRYIIRHLRR